MREIKFRGKGIADNEWYYGDLIQSRLGTAWIITEDYTTATEDITLNTCASPQIKQDTIGQYTGLKDENEVEIYDGDIIKCSFYPEYIFEIKFTELCWYMRKITTSEYINLSNVLQYELEVIGNIHDNPDLLEKGAEE